MNKKSIIKLFSFGILTWLIPFLGSFPFYSPDKGLLIDIFLFKTIMIILGSVTAVFLMVIMFKNIKQDYIKNSLVIGLVWLGINWSLDLIFLLPMADMAFDKYMAEIGLRYMVVPIYSLGIGFALKNKI